jgi:hypothetical protein
MRFRKT